ncbi:MAG: phage tail-type lysozyme domain-containing protein [Alphaproteobacteria bacterium]|nr:phage tail-type lysozyme domain-containing protein [Alphaproteobacteria bacterium]MDX5416443.1 phage tail-type lysozyme domain-containing protein [Alphaproteobacteria bacterium]
MSYIFGGNTGMSYDEIKRRREIADRLAVNMGVPKNVGEGLNAIGDALMIRGLRRRADAAEKKGRDEFSKAWDGLFAGVGSPRSLPDDANYSSDSKSIANDTMRAIGKTPMRGPLTEADVVSGLTQRGLPEHVAQAFAMNFKDESGLNPGINEIAPIVPGSRGGFGLAQWTGPRRRALEAFAAQRGADVADPNVQMDFLMTELQGPESRAAQSIFAAQDAPTAAAAIVNNFLRPAEKHRARREAAYLGGGPERVMQTGSGGGFNIQALADIAASPYASPGQKAIVQALLQQQMQAMDPMRAMEMERMRLELDALRNPPAKQTEFDQRAAAAAQYGLQPGTPEYQAFVLGGDLPEGPKPLTPTDDMREYEFAKSQGYEGSFTDFMQDMRKAGASSTSVSVSTGGEVGTIPQGYELFTDPVTGGRSMRPIPGGPEDTSAQTENKNRQSNLKLGTTLESLNLNIREIEDGGLPVTGPVGDFRRTGLGRFITGAGAVDFENRTNQVTTSAALSEVQNMRDNSPTGGAVGQLTDSEREAIGNSVTALNSSTSAEEYLRAAKAYRELALNLAYGNGNWALNDDGTVAVPSGSTATNVGGDFESMSREQLMQVDIGALTDEQLDAYEEAWRRSGQ